MNATPDKPYVVAIDQGTTSTRCVIVNQAGDVVSSAQFEHEQIMPQQGWVEHDPMEIWSNTRLAVSEAMVSIDTSPENFAALGVTNQRETTVVWDKATGRPIYNAIVWQDTRTESIAGDDPRRWLERTGLLANSYSAGPKIAWILDHVEGARQRAEAGELLAGTMDTWLLWNLTGGARGDEGQPAVHATDVTNASRTLLMDLRTRQWDPDLCAAVGVPLRMLPEIRPSVGRFGQVRRRGTLRAVPITGILGDQQSAMFGQGCFTEGDAKNTYGTGLFLLLNTGLEPMISQHGLLSTVLYEIEGEKPVYALEGSVAVGGSLVQWLRDQLRIIRSAQEIETLAAQVDDNGGVVIVPAFSGLFAPRWRPDARGVIVGLTRFADRRHIARAALEATALQTKEVVEAMVADSGLSLNELRVDGGMVANDLLMQLQADILGSSVVRPANIETTVMGAAYAAGIGAGFWSSLDHVRSLQKQDRSWSPTWGTQEREQLVALWNKAVDRSVDWA
ncbi:glycerol kinase GlpK [Corynebacterium testudinoris]|uniref:Glycerol kinase n=1 Tax=Corynebacterium testudinoris TaxID=136857 RepID=A0A0G3HB27_9CORY|nr:glycerol kinase GlpK [Corynebacterium testudinoris]AKK09895.1 glycerol kinase [Corynebacterium testudinoris]